MAKIGNQVRNFALESNKLLDKFKGCLVGGLIGDCYGKPYKLSEEVSKLQLQKYFDKLDGPYFKAPYKPFSANTALSNCVANSLISCKRFDALDLSKKFVKEYFENPHRDYGGNLATVFVKLRGSKFADPFGPANEQYFGIGSYGNKSAARTAPIALFYHNDLKSMSEVTTDSSNITHSNKHARNGALLQAWAVRLALDLKTPVDTNEYLDRLVEKLNEFEIDEEGLSLKDAHMFKKQMGLVEKLLKRDSIPPTEYDVISLLGHAKVSVFSVPTAIYCFLRAVNEIPGIETENAFRRTIQYAIALGGDSDTIASMAGAISGACYGYSNISKSLQSHCEGLDTVKKLAENLFESLERN